MKIPKLHAGGGWEREGLERDGVGGGGSQPEALGHGIRVQGHGGMGSRRWHELALPWKPRLRGTLSKSPCWLWEGVGEGDGKMKEKTEP